jgi:hypothetical protein
VEGGSIVIADQIDEGLADDGDHSAAILPLVRSVRKPVPDNDVSMSVLAVSSTVNTLAQSVRHEPVTR